MTQLPGTESREYRNRSNRNSGLTLDLYPMLTSAAVNNVVSRHNCHRPLAKEAIHEDSSAPDAQDQVRSQGNAEVDSDSTIAVPDALQGVSAAGSMP